VNINGKVDRRQLFARLEAERLAAISREDDAA
jgi:hypothetical protein